MRQRKDRVRSDTVEEEEGNERGIGGKGFYACYLLCSLSPRHKGQTYIGFTINPCRRIRQHNGEINSGAWRTKTKRPWEMVLCIYGFPTNVSALQFEWAWQHPKESLAVRKAAAEFKSLSGIANKIKLAYTMLNLPAWQSSNLTVNFFSTKYMKHSAGCPSLPMHMKVQVCSMNELPCYMGGGQILEDNEDDWEAENGSDDVSVTQMSIQQLHDFAKYRCSIEMTAAPAQTGRMGDGYHFREPRSPLAPKGDHRVPVCAGDFSVTGALGTEDEIEDKGPFEVIQKCERKSGQSSKLHTRKAADNGQPPPTDSLLSSPEVEIINLLTPSPDSILRSCYKKRASSVFPKIIDLSESPVFIQL
ncbi:structure-specific endonuclease subunit slx1-like [Telopea speciosissima]|uniref:structure-specific endonuclease subunit slx1-like n=1 Tax=Telopea speciosissima TaxID=54955 RepID=UPI001CC47E50|nr:structure-specific endonuclease subunit slx1-like [Telopea speciosissima]